MDRLESSSPVSNSHVERSSFSRTRVSEVVCEAFLPGFEDDGYPQAEPLRENPVLVWAIHDGSQEPTTHTSPVCERKGITQAGLRFSAKACKNAGSGRTKCHSKGEGLSRRETSESPSAAKACKNAAVAGPSATQKGEGLSRRETSESPSATRK